MTISAQNPVFSNSSQFGVRYLTLLLSESSCGSGKLSAELSVDIKLSGSIKRRVHRSFSCFRLGFSQAIEQAVCLICHSLNLSKEHASELRGFALTPSFTDSVLAAAYAEASIKKIPLNCFHPLLVDGMARYITLAEKTNGRFVLYWNSFTRNKRIVTPQNLISSCAYATASVVEQIRQKHTAEDIDLFVNTVYLANVKLFLDTMAPNVCHEKMMPGIQKWREMVSNFTLGFASFVSLDERQLQYG